MSMVWKKSGVECYFFVFCFCNLRLVCFISFQEILKIFFANSIHSSDFYTFQPFIFDELQHGQVMQLKIGRDLFRS